MSVLQPHDMKMLPLPMYSGLPSEQQMLVFRQPAPNTRKVIVATNVAETSITIDGIVYVIDSGFVKIRAYNPLTTTESLVVVPVSQSAANQRAGRAGRITAGKCFRLFTEQSFLELPVKTTPEMLRTNLATVVLQLKAMGIDNVVHFDFMSPPPSAAMIRALEVHLQRVLWLISGSNDSLSVALVFSGSLGRQRQTHSQHWNEDVRVPY